MLRRSALTCILLLVGSQSSAAWPEERSPNVIMLLADDLGSIDLNCYGRYRSGDTDFGRSGCSRYSIHSMLCGGSCLFAITRCVYHRAVSSASWRARKRASQ